MNINSCQAFAVAIVIAAILIAAGCGQPEVSPLAYRYASSLFTLTNQQQQDRLVQVEQQIDRAVDDGKLSSTDARALGKILSKAKSGNWKSANKACRSLMEAQVKVADN